VGTANLFGFHSRLSALRGAVSQFNSKRSRRLHKFDKEQGKPTSAQPQNLINASCALLDLNAIILKKAARHWINMIVMRAYLWRCERGLLRERILCLVKTFCIYMHRRVLLLCTTDKHTHKTHIEYVGASDLLIWLRARSCRT